MADTLPTRVTAKQQIAEGVVELELKSVDDRPLPTFEPGAHIDVPVRLASGALSTRRYSISSNPARRDAYEQRLCTILRAGRAAGAFAPGDVRLTARALIAMLSGVCTWYRPDGRLGVKALVRQYSRMAFGLVGASAQG